MSRSAQTLVVVSIAAFMATLDLFIVNIAFPSIQEEWAGSSIGAISWVLNGYAIVFAALMVPAGRLADRFGRRRAFVLGLAIFTLASAACAAAGSVEALVGARVVQAVGAAIVMPTSLALLLPQFPPERRAVAIAIWAAIGGVAAASGPPLGGLLVEASWRWVFLVNLPVGALAIVGALRVLEESRDEAGGPLPDLLGTVLLTVGIGALALGFVEAPDWGWGDPRVLGAFAAFALAGAAFLARSASHPSPVVDLSMLRVRSFALANGAMLLFFVAFGAMLLANVLFLTQVWGDSVLRAGLSLAPGPLMAAVSAVPAGRLAGRVPERRLTALGCLLFAVGSAWWLWRMDGGHDYAGSLLPGLLVSGIGVGFVLATLSTVAVSSLPPARLATGSAVIGMSRQIGAVVGVAVLVAVLGEPAPGEAVDAFRGGFAFIVVAALAAAGVALGIGELGRAGAADATSGGAPAADAAAA